MSRTESTITGRLLVPLLIAALLSAMVWGALGPATTAVAQTLAPKVFPIPELSDAHKQSPLPNVLVIGTGGTLAGQAADSTSFQNYRAGTYKIEDLVGQLPGKEKIADVATYQFGNKGSGGYTFPELYDLSLAVDQALESYDGVVVTTGTDTMEEIGYFLDLTVRSPKPVVITGAMRPWDVIGTDAPANLYNAIKLAGSGKTKWFGTVLMLNDVIQAAREVTKSNAHRMDTFETPMLGALGYIDESNIRIYRLNARAMKAGKSNWQTPFDLRTITADKLPIVEIVYNYQDAGGGAIRGLVADGTKGIVTAGTGAGGISSKLSAARTAAIRDNDVMFVTTTRTGSGTMYPGTGSNIVAGDSLNAQHARIMLMLSMAFTSDKTQIKDWFATFGTQEFDMNNELAVGWELGTKLEVAGVGMNKLTLSWPSADAQGKVKQYRVYESGKTVPIRTLGNEARSVELTGLSSGTEYTFTVKAVDAAGSESAGLSQTVKTVAVTYPSGSTGSGSSGSSGSGNAGLAESVISPSAGGKLELGSELSVVVPAGASADDLRLTVEKLDSSAASAMVPSGQTLLSPVFEITKNSSDNFKKPITLSFQFDASAVPAGYKPSVFYYDEGKKEWVEMGGTVNGRIISVESDHLTPFAVLAVKAAAEPEQSGSAEPLFSDTAGHWAATDIGKAVKLGIAGGYPDGTFKPDKTVTRAEFAVLLMNALKREGAAAELVFKDRDAIGTWAGDAVAKAVQAGIINGYADQTFRPNAAVTRAEMVMMIAKSMGLKMDGKASTSFADDQEIPGWARGAVHAVQEQGWIQGRSGNQFAPQGTATRAEAIRVLLNMLETL